ncbi:MAG: MurR/RpiR family transcriptional regulator, partial [Holdemanella sp.]|nr:MurR/RpiR family transcriptional regulator [Holdemanella sp.]
KTKIKNMSIEQLASATYTSPATIVRFCKKLDTKGYTDFRIRFNTEYIENDKHKDINENFPFSKEDSYKEIIHQLANLQTKGILNTSNSINENQMRHITKKIQKQSNINIFGEGTSYQVALDFQTKLLRLGYRCNLMSDTTNKEALAFQSNSKDVNIVISHSGETKSMIRIIHILKKRNGYVVSICDNKNSTIGMLSNDCIETGTGEQGYLNGKIEPFVSYISTHFILDCLYSFLFKENYDENIKVLNENASMIYKLKNE